MDKKVIGIIGGMGPLATCDLFQKIVLHTDARTDQEHPRVVIDSNTAVPNRTDALLHGGPSPVPEIVKSKASLTASEFFERRTILFAEEYLGKKFPDTSADSYLLLTVDGSDRESVDRELDRVADLCLAAGAKDVFLVDTDERKESVWKARGAFLEAIKASTTEMDECDVVVPRNRVADFILYTHEVAKELDLRIPSFGHAGDGNLHVYICRDELDDNEWKTRLAAAFDRMYGRAEEIGGLVSGEHGIGFAKKEYMKEALGEETVALMRGIKKTFDPNGILNPGKLF